MKEKRQGMAPLAVHSNCTPSPANGKAESSLIPTLLGESGQPGSPLHKSCLEPEDTRDLSNQVPLTRMERSPICGTGVMTISHPPPTQRSQALSSNFLCLSGVPSPCPASKMMEVSAHQSHAEHGSWLQPLANKFLGQRPSSKPFTLV